MTPEEISKLSLIESMQDQRWREHEANLPYVGALTERAIGAGPEGFAERVAAAPEIIRENIFYMADLAMTEVVCRAARRTQPP